MTRRIGFVDDCLDNFHADVYRRMGYAEVVDAYRDGRIETLDGEADEGQLALNVQRLISELL